MIEALRKEQFWVGWDSNPRRHCQRFYRPSPLATRAPTQSAIFLRLFQMDMSRDEEGHP